MKQIGELIQLATQYLSQKKIERPRRIAEDLLAHALNCKRLELYLHYDRPLIEKETDLFRALLKRALKEPLQYIMEEIDFYDCRIALTPQVLIPRNETEILVDHIVKRLQGKTGTFWDLCTGSGCIGIAVKKAIPSLHVVLSDLSSAALEVAQRNAKKNKVDVAFREGDLFAPFATEHADFIACNPPYISEHEWLQLDPLVKDHEPRLALIGGPTGLEFYERLALEMPRHLKTAAFLEIGKDQGLAVQTLFSNEQTELLQDWSGKDRFIFIKKR